MHPNAVVQAKLRLKKAQDAIAALKRACNFDQAEEAWSDFLIAASGVYSKLEQGSKTSGPSSGWYGRKKKERKDDPLLCYLHHARNSEEHGIERVVGRYKDTGPIWGQQPKFGERIPVTIQQLDPETNEPVGESVEAFYSGSTIKLVTVVDCRFGDQFSPPQMHLGSNIPYYHEPLDVGELGLAYLTALISEADSLVPQS